MAVLHNIKVRKYYKRVSFPPNQQKEFLTIVRNKLKMTWKKLAKIVGVSTRTLTDWRRERYSLSLMGLKRLCTKADVPFPKDIKLKNPFWYTHQSSRAGGIATYKKYGYVGGDPKYRQKRWREWWEEEGQFKKHPIINNCAPVHIPNKSPELAELIGIILGDGSITQRQITITLNKTDDKYFIDYVTKLIYKLFKLKPSLYIRGQVTNVVISRSKLVQFFVDMGLKKGSKVRQQVDAPLWLKKSDSFIEPCVRGLFDTDGCFYIDRHFYKDKTYLNCGINFTNRSKPLLTLFKYHLERLGLHPTQKTEFSIFLRREDEIVKYFKEIGSSNQKHLDKLRNYWQIRYGEVPKWL